MRRLLVILTATAESVIQPPFEGVGYGSLRSTKYLLLLLPSSVVVLHFFFRSISLRGWKKYIYEKDKTPKGTYWCKWPAFVYYLNGCFSPTTIHKSLWYVMMRFVAFLQIVANATCYSFINLTNMRMQMFRCSYVWCISTCVTHPNHLPEIVWNHCCWIL